MKMKTIENLFNGHIIPCEAAPPDSSEYRALMKECRQRSHQLMSKLSPEIRDELEALQVCRQNALQYEIQEAFIQGFSLGVRLTSESFLSESPNDPIPSPFPNPRPGSSSE